MKSRIPKFRSLREERAFWQRHSTTEFLDELTPVNVRFVAPRKPSAELRLTGLEVRVLQGVLARLTRTPTRPSISAHRRG